MPLKANSADERQATVAFSWLKRIHKLQEKTRMSAGLGDVADYQDRMACSRYEDFLKEAFTKKGYKSGKFSGTGLTEDQARDFLRDAGNSLPFDIRKKYNWDRLIDTAKQRTPPSASDILK